MKFQVYGLVVSLVAGFSLASANDLPKHSPEKDGACAALRTACEGAGFKPGAHKEGKGLWKDCVDKIVSGGTIEGVSVTQTAEELTACKTQREAMEAHHAEKKAAKHEAKAAATAGSDGSSH